MPEVLKGWRIDHRIPVALILALMLQFAGLVWWGAGVSSKVDEFERRVTTLEQIESVRIRDDRETVARMTRIDSNLDELTRSVLRLDGRMDQLVRQQERRAD